MRIEINGQEYIVPGCFINNDGSELCTVPECRFVEECICRKKPGELPSNLGSDQNRTETMFKVD